MPLDQAVIDAGAVRFRPMMLTAAAVIVGSAVILFDPIFQGLAIALMAGETASLALSRMTVPVVYYLVNRRKELSSGLKSLFLWFLCESLPRSVACVSRPWLKRSYR